MDGFVFYWLFWFSWVITTFLFPKSHPDRLKVSAWLLASIALSNTTIAYMGFAINGTGVFILLSIYLWTVRMPGKKLLYFMLSTFIIMLTSVCFLLFELFDPIWILIKRDWLLAILIVCVTLLLHSEKKQRIFALLLGMVQGEILYSILLAKYSFSYPAVSLYALDPLALSLCMIVAWNTLEIVVSYFERNLHSIEKEKEKLT